MCYAFWIATASFFLGPRARVAKVIPEPLLTPALLALPVLAVLVIMFYWLWYVRIRRSVRGIVGVSASTERTRSVRSPKPSGIWNRDTLEEKC
jgi:hypothetical protein